MSSQAESLTGTDSCRRLDAEMKHWAPGPPYSALPEDARAALRGDEEVEVDLGEVSAAWRGIPR